MLEDDLIGILRSRRVVLNSALEALHQYRNITSQVYIVHTYVHNFILCVFFSFMLTI